MVISEPLLGEDEEEDEEAYGSECEDYDAEPEQSEEEHDFEEEDYYGEGDEEEEPLEEQEYEEYEESEAEADFERMDYLHLLSLTRHRSPAVQYHWSKPAPCLVQSPSPSSEYDDYEEQEDEAEVTDNEDDLYHEGNISFSCSPPAHYVEADMLDEFEDEYEDEDGIGDESDDPCPSSEYEEDHEQEVEMEVEEQVDRSCEALARVRPSHGPHSRNQAERLVPRGTYVVWC